MLKVNLEISSDFNQIQIWDEDCESLEPPEWNDDAVNNFACFDDKALFLGVIENDDHNILLTVHDEKPGVDFDAWDHVVEAPFHTPTGNIEIAEELIELPPGQYVVRWSIKALGDDRGLYQLDMWSGENSDVTVLKKMERGG